MAFGKKSGAQNTSLGVVAGHNWPLDSIIDKTTVNGQDALIISWQGGSHTFCHNDIEYACLCAFGLINMSTNEVIYKYRVELKDGREMIITALCGKVVGGTESIISTTSYIERVLF